MKTTPPVKAAPAKSLASELKESADGLGDLAAVLAQIESALGYTPSVRPADPNDPKADTIAALSRRNQFAIGQAIAQASDILAKLGK